MPRPLVSVVMPAYNAADFVASALESVFAQTYPNLEVIVVDDGSTDNTPAIVRGFGERVSYVRQENSRQAEARNNGIRRARGQMVAFLDADDLWRSDKIEKQVALFEKDPTLGLVYCSLQEIDAAGKGTGVRPATLRGWVLPDVLLGAGGIGVAQTAIVPRIVLDEIGLFDPQLPPCEDTDLLWRIAARYPVDYSSEPLACYRIHPGNAHANVVNTTRAWKLLFAKALSDPAVRALGATFRARCRGRLYHMLAGDHGRARNWRRATWYGACAVASWPPILPRLVGGAARLLMERKSS